MFWFNKIGAPKGALQVLLPLFCDKGSIIRTQRYSARDWCISSVTKIVSDDGRVRPIGTFAHHVGLI